MMEFRLFLSILIICIVHYKNLLGKTYSSRAYIMLNRNYGYYHTNNGIIDDRISNSYINFNMASSSTSNVMDLGDPEDKKISNSNSAKNKRWVSSQELSKTNSNSNYNRKRPTNNNNNNNNNKRKQRFIHPQVYKMFHRAQYLIRNGNNTVAHKLLVRCLELNPYDSHSWLALARLEAKLGYIDKARKAFQDGVTRCPTNVHILHAWGHLEQKHGNEALARECWSRALKLDPYNAYVCHALSNLERRLRNFESARNLLERVVAKKPTSALCVSLAEVERILGAPEKARETLQYGLQSCSKEKSKLLLALAWLEEDVFNNQDIATQHIEEALTMDPNNVRVYVAKASMELRQGNEDAARRTLSYASSLDADDGQHYTMKATLELECGNVEECKNILREGSQKFPGDHFLLQRWGTVEAKYGSLKKARSLFERSTTIQPHAPTFVAWAILEEQEGERILKPHTHSYSFDSSSSSPSVSSSWEEDEGNDGDNDSNPTTIHAAGTTAGGDVDAILVWAQNEVQNAEEIRLNDNLNGNSRNKRSADNARRDVALDGQGLTSFSLFPEAPSKDARIQAMKQFEKARTLFGIGLVVDPQHGPLYHAYGNMEMRRGNFTGARDIFCIGIASNCSDITSLYHAWGLLELQHGGARGADVAGHIFRRGIELGLRGSREVENGVGFLLHSLGMLEVDAHRFREAHRVFTTGVSLFPEHSHMLLGRALASMSLGYFKEAHQDFRASVGADPHHAHAWQAWAIAEKQMGNIEVARVLLRQGLKLNPSHGALWQAFAVLEMQQNNIDVARTLFAQSVQRCAGHAQSYQAWACLEVRMGNLLEARSLALQGVRRAPGHAALWTVAGVVEERLGDYTRAKGILDAALKRFPRHGALYKVYGEMEARQSNYAAAKIVFERGLEEDRHCAPLYHAAALLAAKTGDLSSLSEIHERAKMYVAGTSLNTMRQQSNSLSSSNNDDYGGSDNDFNENDDQMDIIQRIGLLQEEAEETARKAKDGESEDDVVAAGMLEYKEELKDAINSVEELENMGLKDEEQYVL